MRTAEKDHFVLDIPISKGTSVNISSLPNHYNELYFKKPSEFRPERWEQ